MINYMHMQMHEVRVVLQVLMQANGVVCMHMHERCEAGTAAAAAPGAGKTEVDI